MAILVQRTQTGTSGVNVPKQTAPEQEEECANLNTNVEILYKLKRKGNINIVYMIN